MSLAKRSRDHLGEAEAEAHIPGSTPKLRKVHHGLRHKQDGAQLLAENPQDSEIIQQQLSRSLCISLYRAGFDTAEPQALESLRAHVEEHMIHFTSNVRRCMQHSRRTNPLPQDFSHTLNAFGISTTSLQPSLDSITPSNVTQIPVYEDEAAVDTSLPFRSSALFQGGDGSLVISHRVQHSHVPKHLPNYPPQHAYKATPVFSGREENARKIREQATEEAVLAEQALRKLMAASKSGSRKRRLGVNTIPAEQKSIRHSEGLFLAAIKSLQDKDSQDDVTTGLDGSSGTQKRQESEHDLTSIGPQVNFERKFWRSGARGLASFG